MVKALYIYILLNRIKAENQIPKHCQLIIVKYIYKSGVKGNIQENQRCIFLVDRISEIYENVLKKYKMKNNNENMSQIQTAGIKQISTVDNLISLNSMIKAKIKIKHIHFLKMLKGFLINCD